MSEDQAPALAGLEVTELPPEVGMEMFLLAERIQALEAINAIKRTE